MTKPKITTIIFDLGNVLVKDSTKVLETRYKFDNLPRSKQLRYIRTFHQSETGKASTAELLKVIHETLVPNMTPKQIEQFNVNTPLLPSWRLAVKLKAAGYRVAIFSNNQKTWPKKIGAYNHVDFFQFPFINSATVGLRKPNLNMYRYLINKLNIDPRETIFIDDREKNLPPAQKLGITTYHYTGDFVKLKAFLKSYGIKGL